MIIIDSYAVFTHNNFSLLVFISSIVLFISILSSFGSIHLHMVLLFFFECTILFFSNFISMKLISIVYNTLEVQQCLW